nr:MAG TPA: hypothetical protein [Caudoviricetes sp.]
MTFHGCVGVACAGAVVHPVFDCVDVPAGALTLTGEVVDVGGGQHALEEVALDRAVREANVLGEGADAEVLGSHWSSFLSFPSDMNKSTRVPRANASYPKVTLGILIQWGA